MTPFTTLTAVAAPLDIANVDTDKIIPARYLRKLRTPTAGYDPYLFYDLRFDAEGGERPEFVLNQAPYRNAGVLVANVNFGCGSSREHAPWALLDYGFRAVISTEIADIFRNNSLKNGLLPIVVDETTHQWLLEHPAAEVRIDLESNSVALPNGTRASFNIERFARYCLLNGTDELGFLLQKADVITTFEQARA